MLALHHVVAEGRWQCVRIEGAGHWMMWDAPAKVNAALADFVAAGLDPDVSMHADLIGLFFTKGIEGEGNMMMRDAHAKVNAALADFVAAGLDPDVSMHADHRM
uniref:Alpha/beta hydrolase n=1 Tax=Tetradesmus obliquus TaxID=3088 RepID=A0A383VC60_TETOB|eukprot:jgi/Sobl393_1/18196/SZX62214.1